MDPEKYVKQQDKDILDIAGFLIRKLSAGERKNSSTYNANNSSTSYYQNNTNNSINNSNYLNINTSNNYYSNKIGKSKSKNKIKDISFSQI